MKRFTEGASVREARKAAFKACRRDAPVVCRGASGLEGTLPARARVGVEEVFFSAFEALGFLL